MKTKKTFVIIVLAILLCHTFVPFSSHAEDYPPADFTTKRMNNDEAVRKMIDLALGYNTVYVNGTVGQQLSDDLIEYTYNKSDGNKDRANENKALVPYHYYAFDCSGIVKALLLWEWDGDNYNYNPNEDVNQDTLRDLCTSTSTSFVSYDAIMPGEFLYKAGHCGIYIGNGYAVECTPIWNNGVQITKVVLDHENQSDFSEPATEWDKHGLLPFISYVYDTIEPQSNNKLQLDKRVYNPGEQIQVTLKGLNSSEYADAYVSIYMAGFPNYQNGYLNNWCYVNTGDHTVSKSAPKSIETVYLDAASYILDERQPLTGGTYKVVLFAGTSGGVLAEVEFEICDPKINEAVYADGWIEVRISGHIEEDAWVGLYSKELNANPSSSNPSLAWHYALPEVTNRKIFYGSYRYTRIRFDVSKLNLTNLKDYKIILFIDDNYQQVSDRNIAVIAHTAMYI